MSINSISCSLPFCNQAQKEQTRGSLIFRSLTCALGAIALLGGILVLSGVPGFQTLGAAAGWSFVAVGGFSLITSLFMRCTKKAEDQTGSELKATDTNKIYDTRVDSFGFSSSVTTNHLERVRTSLIYQSLNKFFDSKEQVDVNLQTRLINELGVEDLAARVQQNFGAKLQDLALPIKKETTAMVDPNDSTNSVVMDEKPRDDEYLFQFLKLTLLSKTELLSLSLDEIKEFDTDQLNILCLRLMTMGDRGIEEYENGTLGAFGSLRNALLTETVPPSLYPLFTKDQVAFYLENSEELDGLSVEKLFPSNCNFSFITAYTTSLLLDLPIESIHKALPHLDGQILYCLIQTGRSDIDLTQVTQEQISRMFPAGFMTQSDSLKKMEELSIETINQLLPKMHGNQLSMLPSKHLKDKQLNLAVLSKEQINGIFPAGFMTQTESSQKMEQLPIETINQLLPNMNAPQLQLIPDKHLKNSQLELRSLSEQQIKGMFPMSFMEKNRSVQKINRLSRENTAYVKSLIRM